MPSWEWDAHAAAMPTTGTYNEWSDFLAASEQPDSESLAALPPFTEDDDLFDFKDEVSQLTAHLFICWSIS